MDLGPLRQVVLELNFDAHGVAATVTPVGGAPIITTGIWLDSLFEDPPLGKDYNRREPRRVLALRRDVISDLPRGSLIVAPETIGGTVRNWHVDSIEATRSDHIRAVVIPQTAIP